MLWYMFVFPHTHRRYLSEVNRCKERHNEKSRELRMMLIKMPSQVREALELENKQPDEVIQWDSPEKERSPPNMLPVSQEIGLHSNHFN